MNKKFSIDKALKCGKRSLRTHPGKLLLGPTGARLWADYLDPVPGFSGRIDFIHKQNIPLLFTVTNSARDNYEPCSVNWYPSHLDFNFENQKFALNDRKFITWDDCAVSCQKWINKSAEDIELKLDLNKEISWEAKDGKLYGELEIAEYKFTLAIVINCSNEKIKDGLILKPDEKAEFIITASLGIKDSDEVDILERRTDVYTKGYSSIDEAADKMRADYEKWFEKVPVFSSSEELLDRTWAYRWFILRHTLAHPAYGNLQNPVFYEGRSHKMAKTPYKPKGWEFSKMIPLSVPLNITDARWYHDASDCEGELKNMEVSQDEDGFYKSLLIDRTMAHYANYTAWATYQMYLVHRNKEIVKEILPSLKKQILGWAKVMGNENDSLLIETDHKRTGKEYQPSYWYFTDFPKDCKDKSLITPLKRVDRCIYQYLNMMGVSKLCEIIGDNEAEKYKAMAEKIKSEILEKMWDEETKFFYDLHYITDEKAMVKNIVGVYPYWAEITEEKHIDGIKHLFEESEFNTPCPFPSASADCRVYRAEGGWQGNFIKGRDGCLWDGPTWPYTNAVALDALALESKRRNHIYDKQFAYFMKEYSFLHYLYRDLNMPYLVEHYNSQSGEPLSDEPEYNHSYYIDLIVKHVVGLNVEKDRLVFDPIDIGLDYFSIENIKAAGLDIKVTYKKSGLKFDDVNIRDGYTVYINGDIALSSDKLEKMEYKI